jgi:hypothetical protein
MYLHIHKPPLLPLPYADIDFRITRRRSAYRRLTPVLREDGKPTLMPLFALAIPMSVGVEVVQLVEDQMLLLYVRGHH